jgi:GTP-binding protein
MRTTFITSAPHPGAFPIPQGPEVAFVGRSNVGKSSLLNRVAGARIARTSKTPGRTQAVNFFEIAGGGRRLWLADLPGYGYAKAPPELQKEWYGLIEAYLEQRPSLRAVLVLIDLRRGAEKEDVEVFQWLRGLAEEWRVLVVGTKADKLPKAKRKPALATIGRAFGIGPEDCRLVSSQDGIGIDALREELWGLSEPVGEVRQESLDGPSPG